MGHRRSHTHTRVSKRGSPEVVSAYSKDKHDTNGEGSKAYDRSRREKRKRKREHEDSSKKKHKEKYKGKNRHHKTKEKPKDKVSRRKDCRTLDNLSSNSDSSTSFLSSRRACRRHHSRSRSRSRSWNADLPWERSHSGSADVPNTYKSKRFKENNEAFSMDDIRQTYEAQNDPMQVEKRDGLRRCENAQLVQVKASAEGAELEGCCMDMQQDGCDVTISRNQEQEKRLDGRKDKVLEVELRQRALANFLRHQDVSCKMDEHMERISPTRNVGINRPVSENEQIERAVTDVDNRWAACLSALSNAVNVDTPANVCGSNMTAHISQDCLREGSELACNLRSNLEEGEIDSDNENETSNENARCLADEARVLYDKDYTETGAPQASRFICKEQHELSAEVERLSTGVDVACTNEKKELSKEHAVEGSLNLDPAKARHDIDSSFQQKTMSVMRGGEMVQVNYKVYIPKRAAELARRRLQR